MKPLCLQLQKLFSFLFTSKCQFKSCLLHLKQIIVNSGLDSAVIFNEILNKESQFGLNAVTGKVEDLLQSGIVDPLKVLRSALQCAVSTAILILFSEVLIGNAPEKE